MDVVTHKDGTRVGLCPDAPNGCGKRILEKTDLIVYQPNLNVIFSAIGAAFGMTNATQTKLDGLTQCWQIGDYNPAASHRFPVIVSFEGKTQSLERMIGILATRIEKPFFVLLPTASTITSTVQDIASRSSAKLFAFEDIIEISSKGDIQSRTDAVNVIQAASSGWLPVKDCAFSYPTPAGAEWGGFLFEFTADEKLTVSYKKDNFKQVCPEDLGMRNKHTKKPTKLWAFLKMLVQVNGQMSVHDIEKVKPTKQAVSKALKHVFQLDSDPIEWSSKNSQYETQFVIRKAANTKLSFEGFSGLE